MKIYKNVFDKIISPESLFSAWDKFKKGKQKKPDVRQFEWRLEENIFQLHRDLKYHKYRHGAYISFYIHDPKRRHISKATVRDRVLHQAIFNALNPIFEPTFISHSFSCRIGKGTHKGINTLDRMTRQVSNNYSKPCFVLKCDIRKFFETVDHAILLRIIRRRIKDSNVSWLLETIIESFISRYSNLFKRKGLPIGNLTSQLFANIYLNEFDYFVKQESKIKRYVRYTDDFAIVAENRFYLESLIPVIRSFLSEKLCLELHPKKVGIRKFSQGIDFLGYVILPYHRVLRTGTKQRMFRKLKERARDYKNGTISEQTLRQSLQSYLGVLSHADAHRIGNRLKNQFWFWLTDNPHS